jgi:double-strand break repair protein MRE11
MPPYSDDEDDDNGNGTGGADSAAPPKEISRTVDDDTLRIMLSTDNHLGYAERDPVRGELVDIIFL